MSSALMALLRVQHSANRKARMSCSACGVRRVAKEGAFAAHFHEVFVFQLVEVMGERRGRDAKLRADLAHDKADRVSRQQKAHDPEPRLRTQGRHHVGITCDLIVVRSISHGNLKASVFLYLWNYRNVKTPRLAATTRARSQSSAAPAVTPPMRLLLSRRSAEKVTATGLRGEGRTSHAPCALRSSTASSGSPP